MHCPKCIGNLQDDFIEKYSVDVCYVCKGIWFDQDELVKIIKQDSQDTTFNSDIGHPDYDPPKEIKDLIKGFNDKIGQCPRCIGTTMVKKCYKHGVTVDICPKCQGIWLDGGEIFQLRERKWAEFIVHFNYFKEVVKEATKEFVQGKRRA